VALEAAGSNPVIHSTQTVNAIACAMLDETLAGLDALIQDAKPEERPALVVALAARLATLGAKLIPERPASTGAAEPDLWITPDRAAEIAAVSTGVRVGTR
jgi:hypothetical protein